MKNIKGKVSVLLVSLLLVLAACSNDNNKEVAPTPAPTATAEVKEAVVEEVVEEVSETVSYLQKALEQAKKTDTVNFSSGVSDSVYLYSNETNTLESAYDYFYSVNAQLRRSPATLSASESFTNSLVEYDAQGNMTNENNNTTDYTTYAIAGEGLYNETLGSEQWFKYPLGDNFKTAEHLEKVIDLFLRYPDQLEITDAFDQGNNPDAAIIQYKLTNKEYVELDEQFRKSFFTGNYENSNVELDAPNADTLNNLYLDISVDKDFNVLGYSVTYMDQLVIDETSNPYDYYYYSLNVYFYSHNEEYMDEMPDEVRQTAVEPSEEVIGD